MNATIRSVDYFNVIIKDQPGEAYRLLEHLAAEGVNLLAFNAIPLTSAQTQFVLFPEDPARFEKSATKIGMCLTGPQKALLVQGEDRLGALVEVHRRLLDARVNVYGSNGVADGRGGYGYVLYVRPEDFRAAAAALGV
ncbi:MAG TPA: hypothetical protein VGG06_22455 [Thermoanaerobaculia bacterium]